MERGKHLNKFYVICFDISNDKNRRKVVKELENKGKRVQKSVFECFLNDKQFLTLKEVLEKNINLKTDSIRYYQLCANCQLNIRFAGIGSYTEYEDLIIS